MEFKIEEDKISLYVNSKRVSWVVYRQSGDEIELLATFTAKGEEGKGYASKVVEKALDYARSFEKIKISCPYIKHWIGKHGFDRKVEYTKLLEFKEALEKFNRFHSPEAVAEFMREDGDLVYVKFTGPFCVSCGVYDYFEDVTQDADAEVVDYEEVEDGFVVKYRLL
ncbi:MAG: N-acetyltransferase [Archaeoglobi archaeon]|nr:N-acetyltransferase [Candidatus Mnemosynella bozhongmuii]